ncbi:hypothetical protein HRbin23_01632 [bacterium HR23]|nr:hypothetical protein HRbin23_01632 [bacterium HR23]
MASLTVERPVPSDPFLAIRRIPGLVAQVLTTALRLVLVTVELLLSLVALPLTPPFLLLQVLTWACSLLDSTVMGNRQGFASTRPMPTFSQPEAEEPSSVRRPERARL